MNMEELIRDNAWRSNSDIVIELLDAAEDADHDGRKGDAKFMRLAADRLEAALPHMGGVSEEMLIAAFLRGESWRKRNDVDRYVAVPEMVEKAARDYADAILSTLAPHEPALTTCDDCGEMLESCYYGLRDEAPAPDELEVERLRAEVTFQRNRANRAEELWRKDIDNWHKTEARNAELVKALEDARLVLAKLLSAGHNCPSATPEEIDAAFWSVDASLGVQNNEAKG